MLQGYQIFNKLCALAQDFRAAYHAGQYAKAYYTYFRVHTTALMCELDQEQLIKLFGNREYTQEDEILEDGLFPLYMVQRVNDIRTVHHMTMDELHLHPREPGILHGERDCITKVCTRRHPEGIPIYDVLNAAKK